MRQVEADRLKGVVNDPRRSRETLSEYAPRWISSRITRNGKPLVPRTIELYESMLRRWLLPTFGTMQLGAITVERVREWRSQVGRTASDTTGAKCYRLLHAILRTAESDGVIPRNPCRAEGASVESAPERPLPTLQQVVELADAIARRYRMLVLLGRELQARLGHGTARAAMIYQHAAQERDVELAERAGADFAELQRLQSDAVVAIHAGEFTGPARHRGAYCEVFRGRGNPRCMAPTFTRTNPL